MRSSRRRPHIRHILHYDIQLARNSTVATDNFRKVHGDKVPCACQSLRWFERFRNNDFSVEHDPRSGHSRKWTTRIWDNWLETNTRRHVNWTWMWSADQLEKIFFIQWLNHGQKMLPTVKSSVQKAGKIMCFYKSDLEQDQGVGIWSSITPRI